ncbi:MAG: hypothetical protein JW891_00350, partial [Candidatus Lokiarchaeota archaeon]|nr:hypothetical protein [Candidatus Lokiarchaeota archaeon]
MMLEITLKKVTKNLSSGLLEPSSAIALLISILEHSESTLKRIECLKLINQFETKDEKVFKVLENLLISENNEKIKILALSGLKRNFLDKALPAMMHSLQYITSMQVLLDIFQAIGDINTNRS